MADPNVLPDTVLQRRERASGRTVASKERMVDIDGGVPSGSPDHDRIPLGVPFQHRPRPHTEPPTHLGRDRHLPLSRDP
jgi:hypothetical protein